MNTMTNLAVRLLQAKVRLKIHRPGCILTCAIPTPSAKKLVTYVATPKAPCTSCSSAHHASANARLPSPNSNKLTTQMRSQFQPSTKCTPQPVLIPRCGHTTSRSRTFFGNSDSSSARASCAHSGWWYRCMRWFSPMGGTCSGGMGL